MTKGFAATGFTGIHHIEGRMQPYTVWVAGKVWLFTKTRDVAIAKMRWVASAEKESASRRAAGAFLEREEYAK